MQLAPFILIYGNDPGLLQSRCWVFETAGFQVSCTANLPTARRVAAEQPVDLLILCHTLSQPACREAIAWADSLPGMRRIVLLPAGAPCSELPGEEVLDQFAGPRELLAAAHRLLPTLQPA